MPAPLLHSTAIITGGGRGIGAATAEWLTERGASVMIASRTLSELQQQVEHISAKGYSGTISYTVTDVTSPQDITRLFIATTEQFGTPTILVNAAAIVQVTPFTDMTLDDWNHLMQVNVTGSMLTCQTAFACMQETGGSIVNISSLGGIRSTEKFPGLSAYVTSKFAITGLTESLAAEGKPHRIRVNCVAPGAVDTQMLKEAAPFLNTSTTPMDIARIIGYLCDSTQSGAVTGSTIEIHSNE